MLFRNRFPAFLASSLASVSLFSMVAAYSPAAMAASPQQPVIHEEAVKPLPSEVASLPQAQAPDFDGIRYPGISYNDTYKAMFSRIYWKARSVSKEQALIATSKDTSRGNYGTRWYGNPKAPVRILELESLTCTHCASFANDQFDRIKKKYIDTGKLYYGIRQISSDRISVTATILAGNLDNSRYLDYTKSIFANQYKFFRESPNVASISPILKNVSALSGISGADYDKAWNDNPLGERVFLQSLGDVTYYSKVMEKISPDTMKKEGFGTPFFIGTDGTGYAVATGSNPKDIDRLLKKLDLRDDGK